VALPTPFPAPAPFEVPETEPPPLSNEPLPNAQPPEASEKAMSPPSVPASPDPIRVGRSTYITRTGPCVVVAVTVVKGDTTKGRLQLELKVFPE